MQFVLLTENLFMHYQTRIADIRDSIVN